MSLRAAILERAQPIVEQPHRPVVDVEIELEARAEQDVARVPVVGNARIAERADEDRVELVAQHRDSRSAAASRPSPGSDRRSTAGAADRTVCPEPRADRFEHLDGFGRDVLADPVAGNDRYAHKPEKSIEGSLR